jgi:hypothetical protein
VEIAVPIDRSAHDERGPSGRRAARIAERLEHRVVHAVAVEVTADAHDASGLLVRFVAPERHVVLFRGPIRACGQRALDDEHCACLDGEGAVLVGTDDQIVLRVAVGVGDVETVAEQRLARCARMEAGIDELDASRHGPELDVDLLRIRRADPDVVDSVAVEIADRN